MKDASINNNIQIRSLFGEDIEAVVRVGLYICVSQDASSDCSIALQKAAFAELRAVHPNWILVDTYVDVGVATSKRWQEGYQRLMQDAERGNLDLIVTKSIYRFSFNLNDFIETCWQLVCLPHPISVYFSSNGIITYGRTSQAQIVLDFLEVGVK